MRMPLRPFVSSLPARCPSRARLAGLVVLALVLGACAGRTPVDVAATSAERLPVDPAVVSGTLDNGLAYVVQRSQNPPGRVALWLHVATGSLNERDDTRGLAHYLEHMAFNGSANFPPGSLIPFFQSLGLTFGRDQNAFTSFDQTVYMLALPDTRPATLDSGLLFLSDVALRLSLLPQEIDAERQIVLEEKRSRAGARQRVRDRMLERLAPESTLGRRLPIGDEATIQAMTPAQFRDYYGRWYVPSNMTVMAAGDVEPGALVTAIARHFGTGSRVPRPAPEAVGIVPTRGRRALVVTDPELTQAEVSLIRVEPVRPPVTTVAAYRRQIVERLGTWMFNRRLEAELAEGRVAFLKADASIAEWARAARVSSVDATAVTDRWRPALADLATVVQRARLHGFTAAELEEARAAVAAAAEQGAQQESTLPARAHLRRMNEAVSRGEPVLAAAQRQALLARLLPGISVDEVSRTFAEQFDPANVIIALTLPAGPAVPTEAQMLAWGATALDVRPGPPAERARADTLLATLPAGGRVVEERRHEATDVWSGWLDNGVRLHVRRVDQRKHEAIVRITLAGGVIEERGADRGVTEAAMQAWNRPATRTLSSTQVARLMTGQKVRVWGALGPDTVSLTVSGDPAALERGLQLAYLILTEPVVEAAGFEQWRERALQEITERAVQPRGVMAEAEADAFYPIDQVRLRPLTAPQVRALGRDAVEHWLRALVAHAPIEVSVVGDIDREQVTALVARYLGALPARPRIGQETLSVLRAVHPPAAPIRVSRTVPTRTDQAFVAGGFFGADLRNVRDVRLLALASRILSTRMNRVLREERQLVYSIGAYSRPGEAYPGFGVFAAQAPTDPAKAETLADAVDAMFTDFASHGPTEEELQVAKRQLTNQLDEDMKGPDFWSTRLAALDYRGLTLDDVVSLVPSLQSYTVDEVREAFARHARAESRFRFIVVPAR